jgi:hypothetical protein
MKPRTCACCYGQFWPSITSHRLWCGICAGTTEQGRKLRNEQAEERRKEIEGDTAQE